MKALHHTRLILAVLLLTAVSAFAHPILQNRINIDADKTSVKLEIQVSLRELVVIQGLAKTEEEAVEEEAALDAADHYPEYLLSHVELRADGLPLEGKVTNIKPPKQYLSGEGLDRTYFLYTILYPLAEPPGTISISHRMCVEFPSAPGVPWDLSYSLHYHDLTLPADSLPVIGVIPREQEMVYVTNWAAVPQADPAIALRAANRWSLLCGLVAALLVASWLGSPFPAAAGTLRWPVTVILIAGGLMAALQAPAKSEWALASSGCVIACLMGMDRLFAPGSAAGRRTALLCVAGLGFLGLLLITAPWPLTSRGTEAQHIRYLLPIAITLAALPVTVGENRAATAVRQILALAFTVAALYVLLEFMDVSINFFSRSGA